MYSSDHISINYRINFDSIFYLVNYSRRIC